MYVRHLNFKHSPTLLSVEAAKDKIPTPEGISRKDATEILRIAEFLLADAKDLENRPEASKALEGARARRRTEPVLVLIPSYLCESLRFC